MAEYTKWIKTVRDIVGYCFKSIVDSVVPSAILTKKDISQDIALVTGAGSGIGRELAVQLALKCSAVILWDVDEAGNERTAERIRSKRGKAHTYTVDVSNREKVYQTAKQVSSEVGTVTILVNNAGIIHGPAMITDYPDESIERLMNVNVMGHFWTLKAFLPAMIEQNQGHLVCLSSVSAFAGMAEAAPYCISKCAVTGLMECVLFELKAQKRDIHCLTVHLCPVDTPLMDNISSMTAVRLATKMKPDFVASRIVDAIQRNLSQLYLPAAQIYAMKLIKMILPIEAFELLLRLAFGDADDR